MKKEEIRFDFESFLEEHEQNLPEGLDPLYLSYVRVIERPIKNIRKLPKAIATLPPSVVLNQSWKSISQIFLIILILGVPSIASQIYVASLFDKTGIAISLVFFILLGVAASPIYLKTIYNMLNSLMDSKKAPWLVEEVNDSFDELYQKSWNKNMLRASLILPVIFEIKILLLVIVNLNFSFGSTLLIIIWLILGHLGASLMIFLSMLSFYFVVRNTGIYDLLLVKIINRVKGYTEGQESILTKKNYEVVRVLSDTPGLSIRSLGDIPTYGLLSSIFVFISLLFLIISPYLIDGFIADTLAGIEPSEDDPTNLTYVILLGIFVSSIAAFGAVIRPLFRISTAMNKFKTKALVELDPFLFDEITSLALKRELEISNETQILYILRSYIYTMKTSPVAPFKLIVNVLLALFYGTRIIPLLVKILGIT